MGRRSTIDKLPKEIRELIGGLREQGRTIDEIMAKLGELDCGVSRSSLGRHLQRYDAIGEELRRSRAMAEALVKQFGDEPDSRVARFNLEMAHSMLSKLMINEEGTIVTLDPKEAMFLTSAMKNVVSAEKTNADRTAKARAEATKEAADSAGEAMKEAGLSEESVRFWREKFLGVRKPKAE